MKTDQQICIQNRCKVKTLLPRVGNQRSQKLGIETFDIRDHNYFTSKARSISLFKIQIIIRVL